MEKGGETKKRETRPEKPYKGIRMRKWGKWVAEIREPNKRTRMWLGSYSTAIAAARAYDTANFYLRGPTARLNFPHLLISEATNSNNISINNSISSGNSTVTDMSPASIRKKAIEVGTRVDALETTAFHRRRHPPPPPPSGGGAGGGGCCWFDGKPDLNKKPEPEDSGSEE